jgi:hypothetical protein
VKIDALVFQVPPEPLDEDVVEEPSLAILGESSRAD